MQFILLGMGLGLLLLVWLVVLAGFLLFVRPLTLRRLKPVLLFPVAAGALLVAVGALLVAALFAVRLAGTWLGEDDFDRYRAIYGRETDMADAQMLSDGFYKGWAREVWLRAEPDPAQHAAMRALPGLTPSALDPGDIAALGSEHALLWWYGAYPEGNGAACRDPPIRRTEAVARWREILLIECPSRGQGRPLVYVLARGDLAVR